MWGRTRMRGYHVASLGAAPQLCLTQVIIESERYPTYTTHIEDVLEFHDGDASAPWAVSTEESTTLPSNRGGHI